MAVIVTSSVFIKPERLAEAIAFMRERLPDTRAADGCQFLEVSAGTDRPEMLFSLGSNVRPFVGRDDLARVHGCGTRTSGCPARGWPAVRIGGRCPSRACARQKPDGAGAGSSADMASARWNQCQYSQVPKL